MVARMSERRCDDCSRRMRGKQDIRSPRGEKMVCIECKEKGPMIEGPHRTTLSRRKTAHGGGDGQTLHHCPGCGSGGIVGRSDGSIECTLCNMVFTVQLQPASPFMPQTVNGEPVQIPGMPDSGADDLGDALVQDDQGDPDSPDATVGMPGFSDDEIPSDTSVPEDDDQFLTSEGSALSRKHLVQRLALDAVPPQRRQALLERFRVANQS